MNLFVCYDTEYETVIAPREGDAGFDLASAEMVTIYPRHTVAVNTGARMTLPAGTVGLIRDRSGMAARGIVVTGGVIDASYRGLVKVLLTNTTDRAYDIDPGDRVAQMLVLPALIPAVTRVRTVMELGETVRANGGFGSTGK